jgi:hypothetical protein
MKLFDFKAIEKKYPLPPFDTNEGALYVHILRFDPRTVIWSVWVLKVLSVAVILVVAIMGYRLYASFSPGLTTDQREFLTSIVVLLIALGAFFGLVIYYLSTRLVRDVFDRWYHLTGDFVEFCNAGSVKKICWKDVKKKKFWSFGRFRQGKVSTDDKSIIFTINFVKAVPRPLKVKSGFLGIRLIYEGGKEVRLEEEQKEIFDDARRRLHAKGK